MNIYVLIENIFCKWSFWGSIRLWWKWCTFKNSSSWSLFSSDSSGSLDCWVL